MRDEWTSRSPYGTTSSNDSNTPAVTTRNGYADSRSSQGLTRVGRQTGSGLDRSATLNLTARAMKLKMKTKGLDGKLRQREVSERRQVGDVESVVNAPVSSTSGAKDGAAPWWKNVTMEEGM
jgi:hypothetical protein